MCWWTAGWTRWPEGESRNKSNTVTLVQEQSLIRLTPEGHYGRLEHNTNELIATSWEVLTEQLTLL